MTPKSRAGLTLMELMVALTITGVATALGYQAFSSLVDHRATLRAATIETERAAALRETLHEWMTTGQIMIQTGAMPPLGASGTSDVLTLTTTALTPSQSPSTVIRLFIDEDPATPEQGLTIQYTASLADSLTLRELAPWIAEMRVEFLDARTNRWYPAREAATIQPMAVQVSFDGTAEAPLPPLFQLPLTISMQDEPVRRPT